MVHIPVVFSAGVEGPADAAVLNRVVEYSGAVLSSIYGENGKDDLRRKVGAFNTAAIASPWVVLVDLHDEFPCAPQLRAAWLPNPSAKMCFQVAVRAIESWLLADRTRMSTFLSVPASYIPGDPDLLDDPKEVVVDIARRSRSSVIRIDMVPRAESGRKVGPAYTSRIIGFARDRWRPGEAARSSDSLRRCIDSIHRTILLPRT